jgi:hypothetical protein
MSFQTSLLVVVVVVACYGVDSVTASTIGKKVVVNNDDRAR